MKDSKIDNFIEYLKKQNVVKKNLYQYRWLSGCQTEVHPIIVWEQSKKIVLQWKSDREIFNKFIKRVKPGIKQGGVI